MRIFDVLHVFLPLTIAELSTLKQVRFFWPTLYRETDKYTDRPNGLVLWSDKLYPIYTMKRAQ